MACSRLSGTSVYPSVFISHYNGHGIKLVRPLSTVDNTRDYARVSHSRQWSNYNINLSFLGIVSFIPAAYVHILDRYVGK